MIGVCYKPLNKVNQINRSCFFFFNPQYGAEGVEPLVSEDKVMFGIHAHAKSVLTLAKIRKHYRRSDTKAVAREVRSS